VIVDANPRTAAESRARGQAVVYGDASRRPLLARVGIERARLVAVAISDPIATREIVRLAREMAPRAQILTRTRYVLEVDELAKRGADVVVAEEYEASIDLLSEALRRLDVPDGAIASFTAELREEGYEALREPAGLALDPWLAELLEQVTTEWLEVPASFRGEAGLAALGVRERTGATVLAVERGGVTQPNPRPDEALRGGDRVLAFGSGTALASLRGLLAELAEPPDGGAS
jgi:CPA2 family monovalent cation:H+ antiporter-2